MKKALLLAILLAFPIAFAVPATVSFNQSVYSMGSTADISLVDPDYNTDPGSPDPVYVRVNSTSDASGISVLLTETGKDTGVFVSAVPVQFSTYTSQDEMKLRVSYGDTVYVFHEDDNNQYTWNSSYISYTAHISADNISYYFGSYVNVDVSDLDNPDSQITIRVNSSSDPSGFQMQLSKNENGTYSGSFQMYSYTSPSEKRILAQEGDIVWITYEDPTDENGNRRNVSLPVYTKMEGVVEFDSQYANSNPSINQYYSLGDIATVYVTDYDLNTNRTSEDEIILQVSGKNNNSKIEVVAKEVSPDSGVFKASFSFSESLNDDYNDILLVSNGDIVNASYFDSETYGGQGKNVSNIAKYYTTLLARIYFSNDTFYPNSTITITIEDPDRNVIPTINDGIESRYSKVYSDDDSTGFNISIWENSADSGVFSDSSIEISNHTDPVNHTIKAMDGSRIYFTYFDCKNAFCTDNITQTINATYLFASDSFIYASYVVVSGETVTITVYDNDSYAPDSPTVNISYSEGVFSVPLNNVGGGVYEGQYTFGTVQEGERITLSYLDLKDSRGNENITTRQMRGASDASISAHDSDGNSDIYPSDSVIIEVSDPDRNTDPSSNDMVSVRIHDSSGSYYKTLYETSPDSGIFSGSEEMSYIASMLSLTNGSTFYVTYEDPYNSTGLPENTSAQLKYIVAHSGSLFSNVSWMNSDGEIAIYLSDADLTDTEAQITAKSSIDETTVVVKDSGEGYEGKLNISTGSLNGLKVMKTDTIELIYHDELDSYGKSSDVSLKIPFDSEPPSLSASADKDWYTNGDTIQITVESNEPFNVTDADFSPIDSSPGSYSVSDTGTVSIVTYTISTGNSREDGIYNVTITGEDAYGNAASVNVTITLSKLRANATSIDFGKLHPGEKKTVPIKLINDDIVTKTLEENAELYMDADGYYSAVNYSKSLDSITSAFMMGENRIWYEWLSSDFDGSVPQNSEKEVAITISVPERAMPGKYYGAIEYSDSIRKISIPVSVEIVAPYVVAFYNGSLLQNYSTIRKTWNLNTGTKNITIELRNTGNENTTIAFYGGDLSNDDGILKSTLPPSMKLNTGERKNATILIPTSANESTYSGIVYISTGSSPFNETMLKLYIRLTHMLYIDEFFYQTSAYDKVAFNMSIKYADGADAILDANAFSATFKNSTAEIEIKPKVYRNSTYYVEVDIPETNTENFTLSLLIEDGKGNYVEIKRNYSYVDLSEINPSDYLRIFVPEVSVVQNGTKRAYARVENTAMRDIEANISSLSEKITGLPKSKIFPAMSNTTLEFEVAGGNSIGISIEKIVVGGVAVGIKVRTLPNNSTIKWMLGMRERIERLVGEYRENITYMKSKGYRMEDAEAVLAGIEDGLERFSDELESGEYYSAYMTLSSTLKSIEELDAKIRSARKSKTMLIASAIAAGSLVLFAVVYLFGPGGSERRKRLVKWVKIKYREWKIKMKMRG